MVTSSQISKSIARHRVNLKEAFATGKRGNGKTTDTSRLYTAGGPESGLPFSFPQSTLGESNGDGLAPGDQGGRPPSLLVYADKSVIKLNRRRRRCFHRVMSGLERGGCFRVLMLSSEYGDKRKIQRAWRSLVAWAKSRGLLGDYLRVPELTEAGCIHLHVVYRGKFIDRLVLMREWYKLVGGAEYMPGLKYIYLQKLHSRRGLAHYLAKYMAKGNTVAGNYSWSWGWVWRGFVRDWHSLVRVWRCANNGWGDFAGRPLELSFKWLLDRWRWHLATGLL